eukprot:TRINITY_DN7203_c0_g1_i11.p1 TRINITY_DN7203_c0_g1~~TRINITY_DN7203_c0_g1_i11.p1  ORF type:complete len:525 (+),score=60.71 TRINITY_DN7203_c0_g1_i11:36-1577(+)
MAATVNTHGHLSRWVPLLACLAVELCGGSIYITGLYTSDLKKRFFQGVDGQSQIENLVFACNLGAWTPAAGFFYDSRIGGGRNTALIGALLTFVGYLGVWAWFAGHIDLQYWQVFVFWFIWGHGAGWLDGAAMATVTKNFPMQRGRAVALAKSFFGLSGSILTATASLFFPDQASSLLLFLCLFLSGFGAACAPLLVVVPSAKHCEQDSPVSRLNFGLGLMIVIAFFLVIVSLVGIGVKSVAFHMLVFGVILFLLSFLATLATGVKRAGSSPDRHEGQTQPPSQQHSARASMPLGIALRTLDYWLLFFLSFAGFGTGLMEFNNISQMESALGESDHSVLVSLMSVANCCGRIFFGLVPDTVAHKISRPPFLVVNLVLMGLGHCFVSVGNLMMLFLGAVTVGFSYGGFWTLVPSLVAELFGMDCFATLYNIMSISVSAGSLIFSTVLAGQLYDREAKIHPAHSGSGCVGPTCYRLAALVSAGVVCVGILAATVLGYRVANCNSRLIAELSISMT